MTSKDQAQRGRYTRRDATHRDTEQRGRDTGERPARLKGGTTTKRAGTTTVSHLRKSSKCKLLCAGPSALFLESRVVSLNLTYILNIAFIYYLPRSY